MTRATFIELVRDEIEEAVMRAQGIGDGFMCDDSPDERAQHIASFLPDHVFTNQPETKP